MKFKLVIVLLLNTIVLFSGCTKDTVAQENNVYVQRVTAFDSSVCYVIMQGDRAVGGNCK